MGPTQNTSSTSSVIPSTSTGSAVLDSAGAAIQQTNEAVKEAAELLRRTPMYSSSANPQPVMPVPSARATLFQGASAGNLVNVHPQTPGGQRAKGIGMIAGSAANIVGKYFQRKEQEKTQLLAQDIHRTLELYQGIEEAKQLLQQDPNNSSAKAALQKNQALLTAVLNGKNGKEIAKAFDVTFGQEAHDTSQEDKNKSMHYQATQMAMKQMQQDKAKQFQEQMPQRMMLNPAYQQAYGQYQAALKAQSDAQKAMNPMVVAGINQQGRVEQEQLRQEGANARTLATLETRAKIATDRNDTQAKIAANHDLEHFKATMARVDVAKQVLQNPQKLELEKMKMGAGMYRNLGAQINNLENQNSKLLSDLDRAKKNKDKSQESSLKDKIDANNSVISAYKESQGEFLRFAVDDDDADAVFRLIHGDDDK